MSIIKNRSTSKGKEFWDHVDNIAGQMKAKNQAHCKLCDCCFGSRERCQCEVVCGCLCHETKNSPPD